MGSQFVNVINETTQEKLIIANTAKIDPILLKLLSLCTPHKHESRVVSFIKSLPFIKENCKLRLFDKEMNNQIYYVGESETIFSCHMDIVGNVKGKEDDTITLMELETTDPSKVGIYFGAKKYSYINEAGEEHIIRVERCPLGADDKVGVYILLKMIEAKIPGVYIFHTGEECGGLGSKSLVANHPTIFKNIKRAIAFDRANYGDVISFQTGGRCCSKEFGEELASSLNEHMPPRQQFKNEVRGTFTDTASYMKCVPECTNISVGYWNQHGPGEHFDHYWLKYHLLPAILKIDYEKLLVKRDPKISEFQDYSSTIYSSNYKSQNYTPKKQAAWKDATISTPYLEFPEWRPELGFVEEADTQVLITAIGRFITNTPYGEKRNKFVEWLINLMEYKNLLEEENTSFKMLLGIPTNAPSGPKEEEEENNLEQPIDIQRAILVKLITIADSPGVVLYGQYKGLLGDYKNRAKKILRKSKNKKRFTGSEIEKFNKTLFALATLLDCSEIHTPDMELILNQVEDYVKEHGHEEGFEVTDRRIIKKEEDDLSDKIPLLH